MVKPNGVKVDSFSGGRPKILASVAQTIGCGILVAIENTDDRANIAGDQS